MSTSVAGGGRKTHACKKLVHQVNSRFDSGSDPTWSPAPRIRPCPPALPKDDDNKSRNYSRKCRKMSPELQRVCFPSGSASGPHGGGMLLHIHCDGSAWLVCMEGSLGRCAVRHGAAYASAHRLRRHTCAAAVKGAVSVDRVIMLASDLCPEFTYCMPCGSRQVIAPTGIPDTAGAQLSCRGTCMHGIKSGLLVKAPRPTCFARAFPLAACISGDHATSRCL